MNDVLVDAQSLAKECVSEYIGLEHLLYAVLCRASDETLERYARFGLTPDVVHRVIAKWSVHRVPVVPTESDLPYSPHLLEFVNEYHQQGSEHEFDSMCANVLMQVLPRSFGRTLKERGVDIGSLLVLLRRHNA